ncbi:MAG: histidine kinase [Bryobacterales bacterium]|nr:histidine kinase [Acidobacteriota bacterium]MCB9383991.1 histidine kinase [Bryobacterales bacterium]
MDDRASLHLSLLVNALGHLLGVVVFAAFLVLLHRSRRRAAAGELRATEAAALLALLWNAGSLAVLALGSVGAPGEATTAAVSFAALSLMPSVLLQLSLGPGRRMLKGLGYALSVTAVLLHLSEAAGLRSGLHSAGLALITYGFGALAIVAAISLSREQGRSRAAGMRTLGAMALFLFAVSFLHFGAGHGPEAWGHELIFHHAGIPLALLVLLQDHRFLLLDVFIRFLGGALLAGAASVGLLMLAQAAGVIHLEATNDFAQAMLFAALALALLAFPSVVGKVRGWIELAAFPRGDLRQALADVDKAIAEAPTDEAALERSAAIAGRLLAARRWSVETSNAPVTRAQTLDQHPWAEAHAPLRTATGETRILLLGPRAGGRRYLGADLEDLERVAAEIGERVERRGRDELQRLVVESELQALRAQINPHFLFNALNALYGVIPRSAAQARRTVMQLADVFRYALTGKEQFVKLGEEIAVVEAYLDIERLRMGPRLEVQIEVSEEAKSALIPALTIQPLVENAVKHGANAKAEGGHVYVWATVDGGRLDVTVEDDGPGFAPHADEGDGHGLENVKRRLRLCYGDAARLEVESSPAGARIHVETPVSAAAIRPAARLSG